MIYIHRFFALCTTRNTHDVCVVNAIRGVVRNIFDMCDLCTLVRRTDENGGVSVCDIVVVGAGRMHTVSGELNERARVTRIGVGNRGWLCESLLHNWQRGSKKGKACVGC